MPSPISPRPPDSARQAMVERDGQVAGRPLVGRNEPAPRPPLDRVAALMTGWSRIG